MRAPATRRATGCSAAPISPDSNPLSTACCVLVHRVRVRGQDVIALAQHFVDSRPGKLGLSKRYALSDLAVEALQRYSWPGNIRELMNVLAGALMRCPQELIEPEHFSWDHALAFSGSESAEESDDESGTGLYKEQTILFQKNMIESKLRENRGNQTKAAMDLGITRGHLTKLLNKLKISRNI